MKKSRILIVDDHPVMRLGLGALINAQADMEICAEAGCAAEAITLIEKEEPDLILMDLSLPDKSGLELLKDVGAMFKGMKVLVISMHDEGIYAERVLRAGGRGYIMKEEAPSNLVNAVRLVLDGRIFVSAAISARIVEMFSGNRGGGGSQSPVDSLSDRELEVFRLIGEGLASKDIAEKLYISVRTVDAHRAHIKEKMGYSEGTVLVREAVRWVEGNK